MQMREDALELGVGDELVATKVMEMLGLTAILDLPAKVTYFSKEGKNGKMQLSSGYRGHDETYHVNRFFDMNPVAWTQLIAKMEEFSK